MTVMQATSTSTTPATARLTSHVSIDTLDLARSAAFYRALFGVGPALEKPDYVRFWPEELGLVLGLNLRKHLQRGGGALQHLGVLYPDAAALAGARERLAKAGFATHGEEDTECCYARLDQFWATDPSGVEWELFLAHETVVAGKGEARSAGSCCAPECCS
jgi:catechol 2,3-dioxygenase-like lactoylglutathione lyase family enzyme